MLAISVKVKVHLGYIGPIVNLLRSITWVLKFNRDPSPDTGCSSGKLLR
jgi:hypothetical protein